MTTIINANSMGILITPDSSNSLQIQTNTLNCLLVSQLYGSYPTANFNSTGAIILPYANQTLPLIPAVGMLHYDSANGHIWVYKTTGWSTFV